VRRLTVIPLGVQPPTPIEQCQRSACTVTAPLPGAAGKLSVHRVSGEPSGQTAAAVSYLKRKSSPEPWPITDGETLGSREGPLDVRTSTTDELDVGAACGSAF